MTNENDATDQMVLPRLAHLLDVHGGDAACWPVLERAAMTALLAQSRPARVALAEARALDQVLQAAPARTRTAQLELTARIVKLVQAEGSAQSNHSPPGLMPARRATSGRSNPAPVYASASRRTASLDQAPGRALVGGLLAASILMGLWLGGQSPVSNWIDSVVAGQFEIATETDIIGVFETDAETGGEDVL